MTTINFSVLDNKWINLLPNYKKIIKNTAKQAFSETNNHVNKKYEISFALLNDTLIKKLNTINRFLERSKVIGITKNVCHNSPIESFITLPHIVKSV